MQEIWLPSNTPNSKAVGRFDDFVKHFTDQQGKKQTRTKLMLYTKVPGAAEPSSQTVLDDKEGNEIKASYSLAWEDYLRRKASPQHEAIPTATEYGVKGTPIEHANFLGKDYIARLKMMGFLTIEQLADMSDAACNNVGFGARQWKRKAAEYLDHAAPKPVDHGPMIAEMMAKLDEANALMAKQAEVIAKQGETIAALMEKPAEEAPKPRRGRSPKSEAQPEA
jgi:hypothetical protein